MCEVKDGPVLKAAKGGRARPLSESSGTTTREQARRQATSAGKSAPSSATASPVQREQARRPTAARTIATQNQNKVVSAAAAPAAASPAAQEPARRLAAHGRTTPLGKAKAAALASLPVPNLEDLMKQLHEMQQKLDESERRITTLEEKIVQLEQRNSGDDRAEATTTMAASKIKEATTAEDQDGTAAQDGMATQLNVDDPPQRTRARRRRKRVLLLADSHGRHCAAKLGDTLGAEYEVSSVVKPGAKLQDVVCCADKLTSDFTVDDTVIILGGTNDMLSTTDQTLEHTVQSTVSLSRHTKLIINPVPYRYDERYDNINEHIESINQLIHKSINHSTQKISENIQINFGIQSLPRSSFTRHGLHLTDAGKSQLVTQWADRVKGFMTNFPPPIQCLAPT